MRDLKFRYWDGENTMVDWGCMRQTAFNRNGSSLMYDLFTDYDEGVSMMQFTGLKDANGVDVYEGDLLRIPAKTQYDERTYNCFEVFYHDNDCIGGQNIGFCMNRMHTHGSSGGGQGYKFTPNSIRDNGFVVIGNIYENPELIK